MRSSVKYDAFVLYIIINITCTRVRYVDGQPGQLSVTLYVRKRNIARAGSNRTTYEDDDFFETSSMCTRRGTGSSIVAAKAKSTDRSETVVEITIARVKLEK